MEVVVVFRYPDIADPESQAATDAIRILEDEVKAAGIDCDSWHVEEVLSTEEVE